MKKYSYRAFQFCAMITLTFLITSCSKKTGCYFSATIPSEINRKLQPAGSVPDQSAYLYDILDNQAFVFICP